MRFRLDKWYLDCVSDDGRAVIFYWASATAGRMSCSFGGVMLGGRQRAVARSTLRPGPPPDLDAHAVGWTCEPLGVTGSWALEDPPIDRILLDGPDGRIRWRCVGPRAAVEARVGAVAMRGTGYVEHLQMTIPPWRLPFADLQWGRFHGREHTLVWIRWREGLERAWAFTDGVECGCRAVDVDGVGLDDGTRLRIDPGQVLQGGGMRASRFRPVAAMARVVPRWRRAREDKWLAHASLETPTGVEPGWVVHEEVRWR